MVGIVRVVAGIVGIVVGIARVVVGIVVVVVRVVVGIVVGIVGIVVGNVGGIVRIGVGIVGIVRVGVNIVVVNIVGFVEIAPDFLLGYQSHRAEERYLVARNLMGTTRFDHRSNSQTKQAPLFFGAQRYHFV